MQEMETMEHERSGLMAATELEKHKSALQSKVKAKIQARLGEPGPESTQVSQPTRTPAEMQEKQTKKVVLSTPNRISPALTDITVWTLPGPESD